MESKNYTDVIIAGKVYTLAGFEEEEYLQKVASYINNKLAELKDTPGFLRQSMDFQTVMLELNLADDFFKARMEADTLSNQLAGMEKELYSLKHELVTTQIRLEKAEKEIELRTSKAEYRKRGKTIEEARKREKRKE